MTFASHRSSSALALAWAALLAACGGGGDDNSGAVPQLAAASGASLTSCSDLTTRAVFANTTFTAASAVAAGTLSVAGNAVPAHCLVTGRMFDRGRVGTGQSALRLNPGISRASHNRSVQAGSARFTVQVTGPPGREPPTLMWGIHRRAR